MIRYAFGVDVGGTTIKLGLFQSDGKLLDTWEIPTRTEQNGSLILNDIAKAVQDKMEEYKLSNDLVDGIGMGVPGPVSDDGTVLKCVNLGWGIFNVEDALNRLTGLKVKAANDANVAALGEQWQGGGRGCKSIVMVTLGTGVGGGIILDGHILSGATGAAGEIGHIPVNDEETERCGCGKCGCLEQYTSANGIVRITKRYFAQHPDAQSVLTGLERITSKDICEAAVNGDKVAAEMLDTVGRLLGKGLASIACTVNPEAFVIGGGMSKAGRVVVDPIQKHYRSYAFHACQNADFKLATLGNLAGIYGGVKMVLV